MVGFAHQPSDRRTGDGIRIEGRKIEVQTIHQGGEAEVHGQDAEIHP